MSSVFIVFELGSGGEIHVMSVCSNAGVAEIHRNYFSNGDYSDYYTYSTREYVVCESGHIDEPDVSEQQENEDFAQDSLVERDYGDE